MFMIRILLVLSIFSNLCECQINSGYRPNRLSHEVLKGPYHFPRLEPLAKPSPTESEDYSDVRLLKLIDSVNKRTHNHVDEHKHESTIPKIIPPFPGPQVNNNFSTTPQGFYYMGQSRETTAKSQKDNLSEPEIAPFTSAITSSPSFNGRVQFPITTNHGLQPETIPPLKSSFVALGDNESFNASPKSQLSQRFVETTPNNRMDDIFDSPVQNTQMEEGFRGIPSKNQEIFFPESEGASHPQIITPEPLLIDEFGETGTRNRKDDISESNLSKTLSSTTELTVPNRPTFSGISGGGSHPKIIKPGKPWPARPEDYAGHTSSPKTPQLVDRFEGTTAGNREDFIPDSSTSKTPSSTTKSPISNRPSFSGISGGGPHAQIIKPGRPWPARPEDYAGYTSSPKTPQLVDRFEGTTAGNREDFIPDSSTSKTPSSTTKSPISNRPSFSGISGGGPHAQIIKPGRPWPARPEDYAGYTSSLKNPQLVDRFEGTTVGNLEDLISDSRTSKTPSSTTKLPISNRPSFSGISGGGPHAQIIKPGRPWPARPEDYAGYTSSPKNPQLVDRFEGTTAGNREDFIQDWSSSRTSSSTTKVPIPNRPSFSGISGGGPHPQIIKPGKPWPARPEDYAGYTSSPKNPQLVDRFEGTTAGNREDFIQDWSSSRTSSSTTKVPIPNRPSFSGISGGGPHPQIIKPGKPWPVRPEDYAGYTSPPKNPQLVDRFEGTTAGNLEDLIPDSSTSRTSSSTTKVPIPNRPSFSGISGGGPHPQIIKPGKPWPARPEDYAGYTSPPKDPQLVDRFEGTTAGNLEDLIPDSSTSRTSSSTTKVPIPNRPSFSGISGGGPYPQIIKPGKPWPARPEDYAGHTSSPKTPQLVGRFEETTAGNREDFIPDSSTSKTPSSTTESPISNRPSFSGISGGGPHPQIIKPGKPWPARPEDYAGYTSPPKNPQLVDRFEGTTAGNLEDLISDSRTSKTPSSTTKLPISNRPSFSGISGGGPLPQIIKPGKPWPARPEDYAGYTSPSKNPQLIDRFGGTTVGNLEDLISDSRTSKIPSSTTKLPISNRPSFSGISGGGPHPQIIKPGKPWPARPEDYAGYTSFFQNPQLVERSEGTAAGNRDDFLPDPKTSKTPSSTTKLPISNRPSFSGISGGAPHPQIIKPGEPWPSARPKDYAGHSSSFQNPQIIKPGEPWPARPEDYTWNTSSPQTLQLVDRFEGTAAGKLEDSISDTSTPSGPHAQIIKPDEPWPARPEDYEGYTSSFQNLHLLDRFEGTTAGNREDFIPDSSTSKTPSSTTKLPLPNRLSFSGISEGFSSSDQFTQLVDIFETTAAVNKEDHIPESNTSKTSSLHTTKLVKRLDETTHSNQDYSDTSEKKVNLNRNSHRIQHICLESYSFRYDLKEQQQLEIKKTKHISDEFILLSKLFGFIQ
ncbi:unnamed protein product [Phaedon cochleariae]|uniref:Uncharacterized protein n=1 Tax=Phaedon cochleariae TaxID=80249 RepID=A0A9P0DFH2_PHACE|nr:unnamed protein product [Phaedon cochleariae]